MRTTSAAVKHQESRRLQVVPDGPLADVRSIDSAPSAMRRRQALQAEDPAMHRRPAVPRAVTAHARRRRFAQAALGLVVITGAGAAGWGAGLAAQPDPYAGPTVTYTVAAGDSIWGLAAQMQADRPIGQVVNDIEQLNGISGGLTTGQRIQLPVN